MQNEEQSSGGMSGQPFAPQGPQRTWSGGSRWALIGCGALIVLLGIGAAVFLLKAKDLFGWMMNELEAEVMESLPANITEEEKRDLELAFDAAVAAVQEDRATPAALQELQELLREALQDGPKRLSRDEVQELIEALDRVSGRRSDEGVDTIESVEVGERQVGRSMEVTQPAG